MTRLPYRLTEIAAVVVALVAGHLLTDHVQVLQTDDKPFVRSVAPGHTAHLTYADERVLDVRTSQYLGVDPLDANAGVDLVRPAGIFLLVTAELTPTRENTVLTTAWAVDAQGRRYRASEKSTCDETVTAETGRPTYTLYCFEVPPGVLDQLRIEISRTSDKDPGSGFDDEVASIDLGITPAEARTMAATTTSYEAVHHSDQPFTLKTVTVAPGPA